MSKEMHTNDKTNGPNKQRNKTNKTPKQTNSKHKNEPQ